MSYFKRFSTSATTQNESDNSPIKAHIAHGICVYGQHSHNIRSSVSEPIQSHWLHQILNGGRFSPIFTLALVQHADATRAIKWIAHVCVASVSFVEDIWTACTIV